MFSIAWLVAALLMRGPAGAQEQALVDAAKREGSVTWQTALIIDQLSRPAAEAFQKRYGVKVEYVRANNTDSVLRIINESRAGKMMADVFDGTSTVASLKPLGLVMKWVPDAAKTMPPEYVDPEGYWVATSLYLHTAGINTNLVPPGSEPRVWRDLLDPKWKGKMVWGSTPATSAGPGFIGHMLTVMGEQQGEEFIRELSAQQITGVNAAARQVLDQVIAGEYAIALNIFNSHPVISAQQGAPTTWLPMQPAMGVFSSMSITKDAPHPNAAKLLIEYLMSDEGQAIFRDADYTPVNPRVAPRIPGIRADGVNLKAIYYAPETIMASMPKWVDLFKRYFR